MKKFITIVFCLSLIVLATAKYNNSPNPNHPTTPLTFPTFTQTAHATSDPLDLTTLLNNEAGFAAYTNLNTTIDFFYIRDLYRTIEQETNDYIIGTMPVTSYGEDNDMHVYMNTNGWVLAYYPPQDPTSKIYDWPRYNSNHIATKPETLINHIANTLSIPLPTINYYDFRYPNATHMTFVVETALEDMTDPFQINIPSEFTYYEKSWSLRTHATDSYSRGYFYLNGDLLANVNIGCCFGGWTTEVNQYFTTDQLTPNVFNTLEVATENAAVTYGGIVLIYEGTP